MAERGGVCFILFFLLFSFYVDSASTCDVPGLLTCLTGSDGDRKLDPTPWNMLRSNTLNEVCSKFQAVQNCISQHFTGCEHGDTSLSVYMTTSNVYSYMCETGKADVLLHASCWSNRQVYDESAQCVSRLSEGLSSGTTDLCSFFTRSLACTTNVVLKHCGSEAAFVHRTLSAYSLPVYWGDTCPPGVTTIECCQIDNIAPLSHLAAECYHPKGDKCSWYTECLEKRYPCRNDPASYAVDFGYRFCSMYSSHRQSFSVDGQAWVNAVRKCLQEKLSPHILPNEHNTCSQIKDIAFSTHGSCYKSPGNGATSVCRLSNTDTKQIFWTLKEGFGDLWKESKQTFIGALYPSFGQIISVTKDCPGRMWDFVIETTIQSAGGFVNNVAGLFTKRRTRSTTPSRSSVAGLVYDLTNQMADTMQWKEKHVLWFGFPVLNGNNTNINDATIRVRVALASKHDYDLNAPTVQPVNVNAAIKDLSNAIVTGVLKFNLGAGTNATLYSVCSDSDCSNSTFSAVPQNTHDDEDDSTNNNFIWIIVGSSTAALFVIICITLLVCCCCFRK